MITAKGWGQSRCDDYTAMPVGWACGSDGTPVATGR
jgi:hypothetical protein